MRLDLAVSEQNKISREKAKALIKEGLVTVNGKTEKKASFEVKEESEITVLKLPDYVSRGGYKLEGALKEFKIDVTGLTCLDIGASTGGFTDCLLKNGAKKVYAVDVGTNQLDESLKNDSRVISMEQTDIRDLKTEELEDKPVLSVCDVSFISLKNILPHAIKLCDEGIFLIKPQFELTSAALNKNGVVKKEKDREKALKAVLEYAKEAGYNLIKTAPSPITGKEGNIEYLMYAKRQR